MPTMRASHEIARNLDGDESGTKPGQRTSAAKAHVGTISARFNHINLLTGQPGGYL